MDACSFVIRGAAYSYIHLSYALQLKNDFLGKNKASKTKIY